MIWGVQVLDGAAMRQVSIIFFFTDTATTEIYTLSLHDALPICLTAASKSDRSAPRASSTRSKTRWARSEEHTSELQSHVNLVCRLLLEKKKDDHPKAQPQRRHDEPAHNQYTTADIPQKLQRADI